MSMKRLHYIIINLILHISISNIKNENEILIITSQNES